MLNYVTNYGDTFDTISLKFYGDEKYSNVIIEANPERVDTIIFDYGVSLSIPEIEIKNTSTLPPWKR